MSKEFQAYHLDGTAIDRDCRACREKLPLPIAITMAFQPIFDFREGRVFAYEALVRGKDGQSAGMVLDSIESGMLYRFDQECRMEAIKLAGRLFPADDDTKLSINFLPNAVYEPTACIRASLAVARRARFAPSRLMFEFTENEQMLDVPHVQKILHAYRALGFTTAIDDFGAGFSSLQLLADLQTDLLKLDMSLIRGIDGSRPRQAIVGRICQLAGDLGMRCIAEGVETPQELATLRGLGIDLLQGYHLARPEVEALPPVTLTSAVA